jgi:hypothetical protein
MKILKKSNPKYILDLKKRITKYNIYINNLQLLKILGFL